MAIVTSSLFSSEELSYRDMIVDNGILVDDKWFAKDSPEIERTRYHKSFLCRQERNRRRREKRQMSARTKTPHDIRPLVLKTPDTCQTPLKSQERRKCLRRSTIAECPTAADIRAAWRYHNKSETCRIRLGALLMDLECFVDNSLIVIHRGKRPLIIGRNGGLRSWISVKCPELVPHYKTLQRIKGAAKKLRQSIDVLDPIPLTALMNMQLSEEDVRTAVVHVQPRGHSAEEVRDRFVWQKSSVHFDARGRTFLWDENYSRARHDINPDVLAHFSAYRALVKAQIILKDDGKCTNENYDERGRIRGELMSGLAEYGEMFGYIAKHPGFLAEAGMDLSKYIGRGILEGLLPERTLQRLKDGEGIGVGKLALDIASAYMSFYDQTLIYKFGKLTRSECLSLAS